MNDKGNLTDKRPPLLPTIIGTGLGSGFWPWGPGTAGSVLGTLIWAVIALFAGLDGTTLQTTMLLLTVVFTILGTWATFKNSLVSFSGVIVTSRVVIDEIVGVWIPLSLIIPFEEAGHKADSLWWAVIALVLFRFYDMVKPLGIKRLDRMRGAFYVMADDILGGVYAAITMVIIKIAWAWVR